MTLHFAYGSNMSRALMATRCRDAQALGIATLAGWRFVINREGYGSVAPRPGGVAYGVLWRLTPRDRVTLDVWENIAAGLYRAKILPVLAGSRRQLALVYLARPSGVGLAKPGYMEIVTAAAREWKFPADYVTSLEDWLPGRTLGSGARKLGEFGWM